MVGRKVLLRVDKRKVEPGAKVLEVTGLRVRDRAGHERVKGVTFDVRRHEIVGIAGVSGNGQSELLDALAGTAPILAGRISFKGRDITDDPARSARGLRAMGVGHVPEDRHRQGLVTAFDASESSILGHHVDDRYGSGPLLSRGAVVGDCDRLMGDFDVRPRAPRLLTALFSGGNQQKIVLAREMDRDPDLLLVGQPTRGVDIGAIEYIHRRLVELRDRGAGILLVSVELDEVLALADRILVMFDGRLVGELTAGSADERTIGLMMSGAAAEAA
jgi:general nucleoside transport system ATP-binding protein